MRDGKIIDTQNVADTNREQLIEKMVGRRMDQEYPPRDSKPGEVILEVKNLNHGKKVQNVSFTLRKGEILGFAGLVGAGRTETKRAVFGSDKKTSGEVNLTGRAAFIRSPKSAKRQGLALLPEDRKLQGLILEMPLSHNISITNMKKVKTNGLIAKRKEKSAAEGYRKTLDIKTPSISQRVKFLSGGNQQKVVIAKWLFSDADIIIMDEPTRGIDVGAKYEIYVLMNQLVAQGKSIIFISSEMNEIVAMSDRDVVMRDGKVNAVLEGAQIKAENVLHAAIG
jgi:ribose transport system ATP-binding protein